MLRVARAIQFHFPVLAVGTCGCVVMIAGTGAFDAGAATQPPGDRVLTLLGALTTAFGVGLLAGRSFAMAAAVCLVLLVTFMASAFDIILAASSSAATGEVHAGWAIALIAAGAGSLPAAWLARGLARERDWF